MWTVNKRAGQSLVVLFAYCRLHPVSLIPCSRVSNIYIVLPSLSCPSPCSLRISPRTGLQSSPMNTLHPRRPSRHSTHKPSKSHTASTASTADPLIDLSRHPARRQQHTDQDRTSGTSS